MLTKTVDYSLILDAIREVIVDNRDSLGWLNCALLGNKLKQDYGFTSEHYGGKKITNFLKGRPEQFVLADTSQLLGYPDAVYVALADEAYLPTYDEPIEADYPNYSGGAYEGATYPNASPYSGELSQESRPVSPKPTSTKAPKLKEWAYALEYSKALNRLQKIALSETWFDVMHNGNGHEGSLLVFYLNKVFERQYEMGQIAYSHDEQYALFNTGLVSDDYFPIYALYTRNHVYGEQPWSLVNFCAENDADYADLLFNAFPQLPPPPRFYNSVAELQYNGNLGAPRCDWHEILSRHAARLPEHLLERARAYADEMRGNEERRGFATSDLLGELALNENMYLFVVHALEESLQKAMRRIRYNPAACVPMYHTRMQRIALLLPLEINRQVDLALMVALNRERNAYVALTVLPVEYARKNARLLTKPDYSWLPYEISYE